MCELTVAKNDFMVIQIMVRGLDEYVLVIQEQSCDIYATLYQIGEQALLNYCTLHIKVPVLRKLTITTKARKARHVHLSVCDVALLGLAVGNK